MGRRPLPPDDKRLRGNPGRRPIPEAPAFAPGDSLEPPRRWKSKGLERLEWGRIVPELQRLRIAKAVHQGLLEAICQTYSASVRLYRMGDNRGFRLQAETYRKLLGEMGMTPIRPGGVGGGSPADDAEAEFFQGPRLA